MTQQQSGGQEQQPNEKRAPIVPPILLVTLITLFALAGVGVALVLRAKSPDSTNQILAILTALYAALTAAYVIVSTLQWSAMREGLLLTRRSNALMQRAWVVIELLDKDGLWFIKHGNENWIDIVVRNVGKLPATSVCVSDFTAAYASPADIPWPLAIKDDADKLEEMVIGTDRQAHFAIKTRAFSDQEIMDIRQGKIVFVVAIKITYTDAVDSSGVTLINAWYEPKEQNWVFAPKGNSVA